MVLGVTYHVVKRQDDEHGLRHPERTVGGECCRAKEAVSLKLDHPDEQLNEAAGEEAHAKPSQVGCPA